MRELEVETDADPNADLSTPVDPSKPADLSFRIHGLSGDCWLVVTLNLDGSGISRGLKSIGVTDLVDRDAVREAVVPIIFRALRIPPR